MIKQFISVRQITFLILVIITSYPVRAQENVCDCHTDLDQLYTKLIKTPAYKDNYRGNARAFEAHFQNIRSSLRSPSTIFDCFIQLNNLMNEVTDNHNTIVGSFNTITDAELQDSLFLSGVESHSSLSIFPYVTIDSDSLEKALNSKPFQSPEGIYNINENYKIGVYRNKNNALVMYVVESSYPLWNRGEIMGHLWEYHDNKYRVSMGLPKTKKLVTFTDKVQDGEFFRLGFRKDTTRRQSQKLLYPEETYTFKQLTKTIQYIKIGSFKSFQPTLREAEAFYSRLEDSLNAPHLVVDLRGNPGGGDRNSDILYKILKNYSKKNNLYMLTSFQTASNAEQFVVRAKELDNSTVLGESTNGTLTYELTGDSYISSSGLFTIVLTSKGDKKYEPYEFKGVEPDVTLAYDSDWLEQTIDYIQKK